MDDINIGGPAQNILFDLGAFLAVDSVRARRLDLDDLQLHSAALSAYWFVAFGGTNLLKEELDKLVAEIKSTKVREALQDATRPMSEFAVRGAVYYGASYLMRERMPLRKLVLDQAYYQAAREIVLAVRTPKKPAPKEAAKLGAAPAVASQANIMARR